MAANGLLTDDSISVLDEYPISQNTSEFNNIPQFRILTDRAASVDDASHYALNLTCQSLQKKNKELEQQVGRLQKKVRKQVSDRPGSGSDELREMSQSPSSQLPGNLSDEYAEFLQRQLTEERTSKATLGAKLDEQISKNYKLQKELNEALDLLTRRRTELGETTTDLDRVQNELHKIRVERDALRKNSVTPHLNEQIQLKIREMETEINRLRSENLSMNQIYQETASRQEDLEKFNVELQSKCAVMDTSNVELERKCGQLEKLVRSQDLELRHHKQGSRSRVRTDGPTGEEDRATGNFSLQMQSRGASMDHSISSNMLETMTTEISSLHTQLSQMHHIIHSQTTLIRKLGAKLHKEHPGRGSSDDSFNPSPSFLNLGTRGLSENDAPMSRPIVCEEDMESLGTELQTLINPVSEAPRIELESPQLVSTSGAIPKRSTSVGVSTTAGAGGGGAAGAMVMQLREQGAAAGMGIASPPQISYAFTPQAVVTSRRSETEPLPSRSDQHETVTNRGHSEVLISRPPLSQERPMAPPDDNRLSGASSSGRLINIDRNVSDMQPSAPTQDVNIHQVSPSRASATASRPDDPLVLNNHPLAGNKPIPPRNIYQFELPPMVTTGPQRIPNSVLLEPERRANNTDPDEARSNEGLGITTSNQGVSTTTTFEAPLRTCPVCEEGFSSNMRQDEFEYHVNRCLVNMETSQSESSAPSPTDPSPPRTTPENVEPVRECPVCNNIFPPGTREDSFMAHVDSHFPVEDLYTIINN